MSEETCNCGHEDCNLNGVDELTVTLTLENDEEVECAVLVIYEAGEHQYIALLPLSEDGQNEDGEVFLYRYSESETGEPQLANIEDDDEYETAAEAFDEWLDDQEFDESDDAE